MPPQHLSPLGSVLMRLTQRPAVRSTPPPADARTRACRWHCHRACVVRRYAFIGGLGPCTCRCHVGPTPVLAAPLPSQTVLESGRACRSAPCLATPARA